MGFFSNVADWVDDNIVEPVSDAADWAGDNIVDPVVDFVAGTPLGETIGSVVDVFSVSASGERIYYDAEGFAWDFTKDDHVVRAIADLIQFPSLITGGGSQVSTGTVFRMHPTRSTNYNLGCIYVSKYLKVDPPFDVSRIRSSDDYLVTVAQQARANVLRLIDEVQQFQVRAQSVGFFPPDNPFVEIVKQNMSQRPTGAVVWLTLSNELASGIVFNTKAYINILDAYKAGAIDLDKGSIDNAQIAHVNFSFVGLGGTGDNAEDIAQFMPDADELAKMEAERVAAMLDFRQRIPRLLFTLEYAPNGVYVGTIIGFLKIVDASGYIFSRHSVFDNVDEKISVSRSAVVQDTNDLRQYAENFAVQFLGGLDKNKVALWLDRSPVADNYYVYRMSAYQDADQTSAPIFSVETRSVPEVRARAQFVDENVEGLLSSRDGNPWPVVSRVVMGSSDYDWVAAALNIKASIDRGDDLAQNRKFSYLNARWDFVSEQWFTGNLVTPSDVGQIVQNVNSSIEKIGIMRTLVEIMDATGVNFYYEGNDTHFDRVGTEELSSNRFYSTIAASIDPDTAMVDLDALAVNMRALIDGNVSSDGGLGPSVPIAPTEIVVNENADAGGTDADGPLQFVSLFKDFDSRHVDLSTFEGMSTFMRALRIVSDATSRTNEQTPTRPSGNRQQKQAGGQASGTKNQSPQQRQSNTLKQA